jgi:solute carrier family 25 2-oxodicarboxylate transporter 21
MSNNHSHSLAHHAFYTLTKSSPPPAPQAAVTLSAQQLMAAGAIAGTVEVLCVQPLDLLATRMQIDKNNIGLLGSLRDVLKQGGPRTLYRGVLPELLCGIPKSAVLYPTYSGSRAAIAKARGGRDDWLTNLCAGALSGVPEALVVTPFHLVKIRMQAKEHAGRYKSAWHCVRTILETEGAIALTTGLGVTIARNCIWNGVYFSTFTSLSSIVEARVQVRRGSDAPESGAGQTLALGFCSGIFATVFNVPFDVVKSRQQSELRGAAPQSNMVAQMVTIVRAEGVSALWLGFNVKAMRMGLGGAVALTVYQGVCTWMK